MWASVGVRVRARLGVRAKSAGAAPALGLLLGQLSRPANRSLLHEASSASQSALLCREGGGAGGRCRWRLRKTLHHLDQGRKAVERWARVLCKDEGEDWDG